LGTRVPGEVQSLLSFEGDLWLFARPYNVQRDQPAIVRRWNGTTWTDVPSPFVESVRTAAVINGQLYAAGQIADANVRKHGLYRWNPTTQRFDERLGMVDIIGTPFIRTLSLLNNRELFVGGSFTTVNGRSSVGYARLSLAGKPWIAQQPRAISAPSGGSATLRAFQATGYDDATVHWLRNGQPLTDGALPTGTIVLGSQTRALRLSNLSRDDDGAQFQMVVTSPCGSDTSEPATLMVLCTAADIAGPGNSEPDGALTADDLIRFVNWFFDSDLRADIAGTGQSPSPDAQFTSDDLIAFVNTFFTGCN
jgi:hypothetical protein